ncbi:MAG TPA: alpha/beta hydrolase family protein [Silvibacterium sp.]|nr:alpha/beta hydrolase family protein [Silvibacterium sp.]
MRDVTFHSAALGRDMQYRVITPRDIAVGKKLPAVYLLHGGNGDFRDWSNSSDVARYAERGLILVMPDGDFSYYTNSAGRPADRYEDYIVKDLISDAEGKFPIAPYRQSRAIAGISMGGFGAVTQALKHPQLFAYAGGISAALDVPSRRLTIRRIRQWLRYRSIFGPLGSQTRRENDPFLLALSADPSSTPYLFIGCGEEESFLATNRKFAGILARRHFQYELHVIPGAHNWTQWNEQLPAMFQSLFEHIQP